MVLQQEEIDACRDAFNAFDKDGSGNIDVWELRQVLEAMGQKPTEEELFQMISEVDGDMSGDIGNLTHLFIFIFIKLYKIIHKILPNFYK